MSNPKVPIHHYKYPTQGAHMHFVVASLEFLPSCLVTYISSSPPFPDNTGNLSSLSSLAMESVPMEELTSGASGRIIPVFRNLRRAVLSLRALRRIFVFLQSFFLWFLLLLPGNRHSQAPARAASPKRRVVFRKAEEEDVSRRRALAEEVKMVPEAAGGRAPCRWSRSLFFGSRSNALFSRSWFPASGEMK